MSPVDEVKAEHEQSVQRLKSATSWAVMILLTAFVVAVTFR